MAARLGALRQTNGDRVPPQVSLVAAAQGCVVLQPGLLLSLLSTAMADYGAVLVAQRAEMQERVRRAAGRAALAAACVCVCLCSSVWALYAFVLVFAHARLCAGMAACVHVGGRGSAGHAHVQV